MNAIALGVAELDVLVRPVQEIPAGQDGQLVEEIRMTAAGTAGDRGWLHPELPASALRDVARELESQTFDACLSSNRTCEAALEGVTGRPYSSFVIALEQVTRR
jgi:D-lactate dehydrogenase